ncbi:unnamed protein product [Discosporangium mesarthrocarpum]
MAFYGLLRGEHGFTSFWDSIVTVFIMSMGEIDQPFSDNRQLDTVAVILFMTFMLLVAIVYLNLLVAMMTTSYEKVLKGATAQALMNRAEALVKWESIMSQREREKAFRRVSPPKGGRLHITLGGWFGDSTTEVFVDDHRVAAVEPVEKQSYDSHAIVMRELAELRDMVRKLTERSTLRRSPSETDGEGSSALSAESSIRKRLGMLKNTSPELSAMRLGSGPGFISGPHKSLQRGASTVSPAELQRWRERAEALEKTHRSKKAVIQAQALIRGYLQRQKSVHAKFIKRPPAFGGVEDAED